MVEQCPLDPLTSRSISYNSSMWRLPELLEIENHVSSGSCLHPPLKDLILEGPLTGSTPLLAVCHQGDLESVKRMVDHWEVDFQAAATYHFYKKRNELLSQEATPLFVAALNCHLNIVQYLIEKGADLSARTSEESQGPLSGLTPLHAAFITPRLALPDKFKEQKEIMQCLVKCGADPSALALNGAPIWSMERRLESITTLIELGMSLTQRCPINGATILHNWIREPMEHTALKIVRLILDNKEAANLLQVRDNDGFTPTLAAAIGNHESFLPNSKESKVKKAIVINILLLELLLERDEVDRMDKINALELAGSVILHNIVYSEMLENGNYERKNTAFKYWHRALKLRLSDSEDCNPILKTQLNSTDQVVKEWSTLNELLHIEKLILKNRPYKWTVQPMLVQLRILSGLSSSAVSRYLWPFVQIYNKQRHDNIKKLERDINLSKTGRLPRKIFLRIHYARMLNRCTLDAYSGIHDFNMYIYLEILKAFRGCNSRGLIIGLSNTIATFCETLIYIARKCNCGYVPDSVKKERFFLKTGLNVILEIACQQVKLNEQQQEKILHQSHQRGSAPSFSLIKVNVCETIIYRYFTVRDPIKDLRDIDLMKLILDITCQQMQLNNDQQENTLHDRYIGIMDSIVYILSRSPNLLDPEIVGYLSQLIKTQQGKHLLLVSCKEMNQYLLESVRLLLRIGADPDDEIDENGDGALHLLARKLKDMKVYDGRIETIGFLRIPYEKIDSTACLLVTAGANLHKTNHRGETALYLFQDSWRRLGKEFPDWSRDEVAKLSCLSARVIRRHRVPYWQLPMSLQAIVEFR